MKRSNGEGTIYPVYKENKLVRYVGQVTLKNGKRKSVYGKTKLEVVNKLKQLNLELLSNSYIDKNNITFYQIAKKIIDKKIETNTINSSTYNAYTCILKILEEFWDIPVQKISSELIQNFLNDKKNYKQSTLKLLKVVLNLVFKEAVLENYILLNPLNRVILPNSTKKTKLVEAFTIEEQKKILDALKNEETQFRLFLELDFNTGLRKGELLALTLDDIDFEHNLIHINKTLILSKEKKQVLSNSTKTCFGMRDIPITQTIRSILEECLENYTPNPQKLLFISKKNKNFYFSNIDYIFKNFCNNNNIKVVNSKTTASIHMIRHTYATRCIEAGIQPVVLQKLLGHSNVSLTLNTYTSVFNKFKNDSLILYENYIKQIMQS